MDRTLASLPATLRQRASQLPVVLEAAPSAELVLDGLEPDTLGLFIGPEHADQSSVPMPPQIVLYLENIWDLAEGDESAFCAEIRVTFLHELGHYLGLDEDDLFERGLE